MDKELELWDTFFEAIENLSEIYPEITKTDVWADFAKNGYIGVMN